MASWQGVIIKAPLSTHNNTLKEMECSTMRHVPVFDLEAVLPFGIRIQNTYGMSRQRLEVFLEYKGWGWMGQFVLVPMHLVLQLEARA
jgi:hypothetical protein